jgi:hypothetical protein
VKNEYGSRFTLINIKKKKIKNKKTLLSLDSLSLIRFGVGEVYRGWMGSQGSCEMFLWSGWSR